MPFKFSKRAQLVGETTAGSFSPTNFIQFENGMMLSIASVRHTFPDGSRFEGVVVAPDAEIGPAIEELKTGKDVVLERAIALATQKNEMVGPWCAVPGPLTCESPRIDWRKNM